MRERHRAFPMAILLLVLALSHSAGAQSLSTGRSDINRLLLPFGAAGTRFSFTGAVVRRDERYFVLQLGDKRILRLRITPQTTAAKGGKAVDLDAYLVADVVQVEALSDGKDYLDAARVTFVKAGTPQERADIVQHPEWRLGNFLAIPAVDPNNDDRRLRTVLREPAPRDSDSTILRPGRNQPRELRPSGARAQAPEELENNAAVSVDPSIRAVRERVKAFMEVLPNLIVTRDTSMFVSSSRPPQWSPNGHVTAEVRYENQRESYREIQVDGQPHYETPEADLGEFFQGLGKAWSGGESGGIVSCLFSPYAKGDFHFVRFDRVDDADVSVFSFALGAPNSCVILKHGSQIAYPASRGSLWISTKSNDILRVEIEASDIPIEFPTDTSEKRIDYHHTEIGSTGYLLPVQAYYFGCLRGTYYCWMNRMSFQNYREFHADSTIRFDDLK
jgi:hypothetical protein